MPSIQRISVIGAGAVGAVYASKFFDMEATCISLIAGGERGERLRGEGLIVNGRPYALPVISPDQAISPSDLIIVAVKGHHLHEAIGDMKNAVGPGTIILSAMNGIDSEEQIGAIYGMEKVLYGVVLAIDAVRRGNVVTYSERGRLLFGEARNEIPSERTRSLQSLFDRAGIINEIPVDMIRTLWWKFMVNVAMNQITAVLRSPYRVFHEFPEARELMGASMREVLDIAQARNVDLSEKDLQDFYDYLLTMSPDGKTSMVQDLEAGRKTEVEMFAGRVIQLGREHGIPTPVNGTLFNLLKVMEGTRK